MHFEPKAIGLGKQCKFEQARFSHSQLPVALASAVAAGRSGLWPLAIAFAALQGLSWSLLGLWLLLDRADLQKLASEQMKAASRKNRIEIFHQKIMLRIRWYARDCQALAPMEGWHNQGKPDGQVGRKILTKIGSLTSQSLWPTRSEALRVGGVTRRCKDAFSLNRPCFAFHSGLVISAFESC